MSFDVVRSYLEGRGFGDRIIELDQSIATVQLAADAIGTEPARILKTLSFKDGEGALLVCLAGDVRIDNRKFKETFSIKPKMLSAEEAVELVGHAIGGVCPFAVRPGCRIFFDESLRRFDEVYPAAGSSNTAVRLSLEEAELLASPEGWVDVAKYVEAG